MAEQSADDFVPAAPHLWTYDVLSFLLTGTRRWRPALLAQVASVSDDVIADTVFRFRTLASLRCTTSRADDTVETMSTYKQ